MVLLSAHAERFSVSRMQDFLEPRLSCKFFLAGYLLETVRQRARLQSKTAGLALLVLKILQARWREGRQRVRERQDRARLVATD